MKCLVGMGLEQLEGRRLFNAASPPGVAFEQYVKGSGSSRTFAVIYDGVDPIDRKTLDSNDIWVFGGNDFGAKAVFVASAKAKRGNALTARYRVDGILGGTYSIGMGPGEVADTLGATVAAEIIGGFAVGRKGRTVVVDPSRQVNAILEVVGTTHGPSYSPPPIDTSFGTVIGAMNFGGPAVNVVGSTGTAVHFESRPASSVAAGSAVTTTTPFSVVIETPFPNDLFDAVVGSEPLFESEIYSGSNATETLVISGLDPTKKYQFQFLHGETRIGTYPYVGTTQTFTLPTGESATAGLTFGSIIPQSDSKTEVRVSGTTGLRYDMPAASSRGPSFSGLVVAVADGGSGPPALATPTMKRKSVRLKGPSHLFDLSYSGATAAGLASTNVLVTGPGGYSARATMVDILFNSDGSQVGTYRIDGIEATGSYAISVDGVNVANPTFFFLAPVKWEAAVVTGRRHRRG